MGKRCNKSNICGKRQSDSSMGSSQAKVAKFTPARPGSSVTENKHCASADKDDAVMNISGVIRGSSGSDDVTFLYEVKRAASSKDISDQRIKSEENFLSSIKDYENSKIYFARTLRKWSVERRSTIKELRMLYKTVHDGQLQYNEEMANINAGTSVIRSVNDFLGSSSASLNLGTDVLSTARSFVQACDIDHFQSEFQEIINHDAKITKDFYDIRSKCVAEYQGIEEVMRTFHSHTFGSTLNKVSDTLGVNKYLDAMKRAYENDDMPKLLVVAGCFVKNACQSKVLGDVCNLVEAYVNDNPAALDVCISTGKALFSAINTWVPVFIRNSLIHRFDTAVNTWRGGDMNEANHVNGNHSKIKLQSQIAEAIDLLESEMEEICDTFKDLF